MEEADDRVNEVIDRQIRGLTKACSRRRHTGSSRSQFGVLSYPVYTLMCRSMFSCLSHSPAINIRDTVDLVC